MTPDDRVPRELLRSPALRATAHLESPSWRRRRGHRFDLARRISLTKTLARRRGWDQPPNGRLMGLYDERRPGKPRSIEDDPDGACRRQTLELPLPRLCGSPRLAHLEPFFADLVAIVPLPVGPAAWLDYLGDGVFHSSLRVRPRRRFLVNEDAEPIDGAPAGPGRGPRRAIVPFLYSGPADR